MRGEGVNKCPKMRDVIIGVFLKYSSWVPLFYTKEENYRLTENDFGMMWVRISTLYAYNMEALQVLKNLTVLINTKVNIYNVITTTYIISVKRS
jgi:hypothetical protein